MKFYLFSKSILDTYYVSCIGLGTGNSDIKDTVVVFKSGYCKKVLGKKNALGPRKCLVQQDKVATCFGREQ